MVDDCLKVGRANYSLAAWSCGDPGATICGAGSGNARVTAPAPRSLHRWVFRSAPARSRCRPHLRLDLHSRYVL